MIRKHEILKEKNIISMHLKDVIEEDILIFDIETTGFSPVNNLVYLVGYIYKSNGCWHLEQLLITDVVEERELMIAFAEICNTKKVLVHFNGNTFDIPFMLKKSNAHGVNNNLDHMKSIDLYRIIKPYKNLFNLENCKLKSVENLIGYPRKDEFTGGELIDVFYDYLSCPSMKLENDLLLHNYDDILATYKIIALLEYTEVINLLKINPCQIINDITKVKSDKTLIFNISLTKTFPIKYSTLVHNYDVKLEIYNNNIAIYVPLIFDSMYYFFENYKEYYYIPSKDQAVHKSVGIFYSNDKRVKAKASNCYIKKEDTFVPSFSKNKNIPIFYKDIKKKLSYILYNDIENFHDYICDVISSILEEYR